MSAAMGKSGDRYGLVDYISWLSARRMRVACLACVLMALTMLVGAYADTTHPFAGAEPVELIESGLVVNTSISRLFKHHRYGITSRKARLFAAPDANASSDSFIDAMTIVRLDAYEHGFVRLLGSEWYLLYDSVDNINIDIIDGMVYPLE